MRAAIYSRVSTQRQAGTGANSDLEPESEYEDRGASLVTQEQAAQRYAADRGYLVDERHTYREVWSAAVWRERPELSRLLAALARHEVDVVVCYAVDRLSRNQTHLAIILDHVEQAGGRLEFVTEAFEDTTVGKFILNARVFAAEVEREKFKERSMRGKRAVVAQGRPLRGCKAPYGYLWCTADDQGQPLLRPQLSEDPATAHTVRWMFEQVATGKSTRWLALSLSERGIPTPTGRAGSWHYSTIKAILHKPLYAGRPEAFSQRATKNRNGKTTSKLRPAEERVQLPEGSVPALVDWPTFEAVQRRLSLNQQQAVRNNPNPEASLLRGGFVRCGYCGSAMTVHSAKAGNGQDRYRCGRGLDRNKRSPTECKGNSISIPLLDRAAWNRVETLLLQPETIGTELAALQRHDPTAGDMKPIARLIAGCEREQQALLRHLPNLDPDSAQAVYGRLAELSRQRQGYDAEREAILARRAAWDAARERLQELEAWCRTVGANLADFNYAQRRLTLEALAIRATVWKSERKPRRFHIDGGPPLPGDVAGNTRMPTRVAG